MPGITPATYRPEFKVALKLLIKGEGISEHCCVILQMNYAKNTRMPKCIRPDPLMVCTDRHKEKESEAQTVCTLHPRLGPSSAELLGNSDLTERNPGLVCV